MKSQYEMVVSGKVQGVGFRYYTWKRAMEHGITGFVRNLPGREVLVVAEGEAADLDTLADYLRSGPPMARVTGFTLAKSRFTGTYDGFDIR
jgi:acylphosphatase